MGRRLTFISLLLVVLVPTQCFAQAHFQPGVANIRDYTVPTDPGVYLALYNYGYTTSDLNDNNGNQISQVLIGPPGGPFAPLNIKIDVKLYALAPALLWISKWKFLGASYGAYVNPSFSNANIAASLQTVNGMGANPQTSQFAVGDLFVQPLWLGWNRTHFDIAAGYGFYAPVGKFDTSTVNFPSGPQVVTSATNVGLGYWTNQLQGTVTWYPNPKRGTAVTNTLTLEFNGEQRDTHYTNGNFLTWNWGADQYLPLDKEVKYLADLGLTGYSQWQVSDSSGPNVANPGYHDQVHAIGAQAGLISTRHGWVLEFRYQHEFYAANRFAGNSYSLNFAYTIKKNAPPPAAAPPPAPKP
jgi:hypothetical protein